MSGGLMVKAFPTLLIGLDVLAAAMYATQGAGCWRRVVLTYTVTW